MIKVEHLSKSYESVTPLKDISVTINDGDVISIIGPSGTGKSTFLRCLNLLEKPTSGKIFYNDIELTAPGCNISDVRKHIGMVFQSFNLFPHLTNLENIILPQVDLLKRSKKEAKEYALKLLKEVGLSDKANGYPATLSGGQKQRIAIARTLAMDCDVILFDEPTSALDPTMVDEVLLVIKNLAKTGKTMLIVTHEMNFAKNVSNRIFYMDKGFIWEDGSPEQIFENPIKTETRRFINKIKSFEYKFDKADIDVMNVIMEINQFAIKQSISEYKKNNIQHCFERIIVATLLKNIDTYKEINLSIEYNNTLDKVSFRVSYRGDEFNILLLDTLKELEMITNQEYRYDVDLKLNIVKFKF